MSYLKLSNLSKKYTSKGNYVIKDMNLEINKGEFIVFLGPSGCGKTTIIRMISGLEDVSGGDILINDKSIINLKPKDREVSMIFQSYAVWPHMSVFDNIGYPLKMQKISKSEIDRRVRVAAKITNIEELLDRYPLNMSGGQRQRVAVSRAIVIEPKLFLMDEPLSNLDAKLRISMRTDLKNIHLNLGATTIFVTHDQAEAMSLADRIVIINNGEIEQIGTPMEVYHNSMTKFVAQFIGTPPTNFFKALIITIDNKLYAKGTDFLFEIKGESIDKLSNYIDYVVDMGIRPEDFTFIKRKGYDYFTNIVISNVEPQGSFTIIICQIDGVETKITTASLKNAKLVYGANVKIYVNNDAVKFFDTTTGTLI